MIKTWVVRTILVSETNIKYANILPHMLIAPL